MLSLQQQEELRRENAALRQNFVQLKSDLANALRDSNTLLVRLPTALESRSVSVSVCSTVCVGGAGAVAGGRWQTVGAAAGVPHTASIIAGDDVGRQPLTRSRVFDAGFSR